MKTMIRIALIACMALFGVSCASAQKVSSSSDRVMETVIPVKSQSFGRGQYLRDYHKAIATVREIARRQRQEEKTKTTRRDSEETHYVVAREPKSASQVDTSRLNMRGELDSPPAKETIKQASLDSEPESAPEVVRESEPEPKPETEPDVRYSFDRDENQDGPIVSSVRKDDDGLVEKVSRLVQIDGVPVMLEESKPVSPQQPEVVAEQVLPDEPQSESVAKSIVETFEPVDETVQMKESETEQKDPQDQNVHFQNNAVLVHQIPDAIADDEERRPITAIADRGFCFSAELEIIPAPTSTDDPEGDRYDIYVVSRYFPVFRIQNEGKEVIVESEPQIDRNRPQPPEMCLYRWSVELPDAQIGQIYTLEIFTHWDTVEVKVEHLNKRTVLFSQEAIGRLRMGMIQRNIMEVPIANNSKLDYLRNLDFKPVPEIQNPVPVETITQWSEEEKLVVDEKPVKIGNGIMVVVIAIAAGYFVVRFFRWIRRRKIGVPYQEFKSNLDQEVKEDRRSAGLDVPKPNMLAIPPVDPEKVVATDKPRLDSGKPRLQEIVARPPEEPVKVEKPEELDPKKIGAVWKGEGKGKTPLDLQRIKKVTDIVEEEAHMSVSDSVVDQEKVGKRVLDPY